jgi:hypothetical protein
MSKSATDYIVICQQAWMNATGYGIHYGWDGERFPTRKKAIKHGLKTRGSDDFNIAEVTGERLTWFGWMDERMNEGDATMTEIADAIGLTFKEDTHAE